MLEFSYTMMSFDDEEQLVVTNLVLDLLAQRLCVVLSAFVTSPDFDAVQPKHVEVANTLDQIKQRRAMPNSEGSPEQARCEANAKKTTPEELLAEPAKEWQQALKTVKQVIAVRVCYLVDDAEFTGLLDATYNKTQAFSGLLGMFDKADQVVLFETFKDLIKPKLVGILSAFVKSHVFQVFDVMHAQALRVYEELLVFESPAERDKYKLEKLVESIFELMAASDLAPREFGDWAPSHNHAKLALLKDALSEQTDQAEQPDQLKALLAQFQEDALTIRVLCSVNNPRLSEDAFYWQEVRTKTSIQEILQDNMTAFWKAKATRKVYLEPSTGDVLVV